MGNVHKHEDPSSDPSTHEKKPPVEASAGNPGGRGGVGDRRVMGLTNPGVLAKKGTSVSWK